MPGDAVRRERMAATMQILVGLALAGLGLRRPSTTFGLQLPAAVSIVVLYVGLAAGVHLVLRGLLRLFHDHGGGTDERQLTSGQLASRARKDRALGIALIVISGVVGALTVDTERGSTGLVVLTLLTAAVGVLVLGRFALARLPAGSVAVTAAAVAIGLALVVVLNATELVTDPGGWVHWLEVLARFSLTVASLAALTEGITRVDLARRQRPIPGGAAPAAARPRRAVLIELGAGIALVAAGVAITALSYQHASPSGGRYVLMYGPVVVGISLIFHALVGGFKAFVAWRYLLVFKRKTSVRTVIGLVLGLLAIIGATLVTGSPASLAVAAATPALAGAYAFLLVVMGGGVLRHSKPSFVMYVLGLGVMLASYIATYHLAPARPVSPFDPVTTQTIVLQVLSITQIAGASIAALAIYFGLLRSVFTFFTVIPIVGVWVGTSALVMVLAVMSGFETDLRDKILGSNAHIQVTREEGDFTDWEAVKRKLDAIPGVVASTPYAVSEVVIAANNNGMNVIIKGIDPATVGQVTNLIANLEDVDSMRRLEPLRADDAVTPTAPAAVPTPGGPAGDASSDPAPADMPDMPPDVPGAAPSDAASPDAGIPLPDAAPPADAGLAVLDPLDELRAASQRHGDDALDLPAPDPDRARDVRARVNHDDADIIRAEDLGEPQLSGRTMALHGILVGRELVKQTHLYTGEEVRIVSPISDPSNPDATGTPIPYNRDYRVAGVFYTGMYEYDLKYVYVTLDSLQAFLDRGDAIDGIEVRIADADDTDRYVPNATSQGLIRDALGAEYRVQDWRELNRSLFSALKLEKIAMFLVLGIVILVASFSIVGNLIMVVVEKAREIALLKTLGASDASITQLFAIQGLIIGLIGTALGIATGLLGCWAGKRFGLPLNPDVYYIDKLPIHVDPESVMAAAAAGVFISIAATLYPALLASRVRPAAGMRH